MPGRSRAPKRPSTGYRPDRVSEMIHRELAVRLRTDVKDPRVEPISITRLEVTRDLSRATIAYLPLGGGVASADLQEGLEAAARQLRGPIGRALRLRHAPDLVFVFDQHAQAAFRVSSLLQQLSNERRSRALDDDAIEDDDDDSSGAAAEDATEEQEE